MKETSRCNLGDVLTHGQRIAKNDAKVTYQITWLDDRLTNTNDNQCFDMNTFYADFYLDLTPNRPNEPLVYNADDESEYPKNSFCSNAFEH